MAPKCADPGTRWPVGLAASRGAGYTSGMSEEGAKRAAPRWAQRPGESFAAYLERFDREIQTDAERACSEELARMDREHGAPPDVVDAADGSER